MGEKRKRRAVMEVERIKEEERQEAEVTARLHKPTVAVGP